jgi:hypothetical protein
VARGLRFFAVSYLAQKYGVAIGPFLEKKAGQWTVMISAVSTVIFLIIYFANK